MIFGVQAIATMRVRSLYQWWLCKKWIIFYYTTKNFCKRSKENYDEYANSGRFLNGAEDEENEDNQNLTSAEDYTLIAEPLPPENDDETILTQSQVETIIRNKDDNTLTFLKQQLGISGRVKQLSTLSRKMAEQLLTRKRIEDIIRASELLSKPLVLNGSHQT